MMLVLNIIVLVLWILIGVIIFTNKNNKKKVDKMDYILIWTVLIINLLVNVIDVCK